MAINPLIALQTQGLDTATPTRNLIGMLQQKEQLDLQRSQSERQDRLLDLREQQVDAEIIQQEYDRQSEEEKERQRNASISAVMLNRVLESQGPEAAMDWIRQNRDGNRLFRLPTEDMDKAMNMLQEGKVDQLKTGLSNQIYIGESLGLIDPPKDDDTFTARNIILPDGERVSGRTTPEGRIEIVNERGEFVRAPQGAQIISTSLQGSEEEIGATNPEIRKFRALEAKMPVVERLQERIAEGLEADEFVGGVSGSTVRLFNSFRSQVEQLHNTFNKDKPEGERDVELSIDKYQDVFEDVTNVTSKVKSGILDLAYMTLKAKGEERVSDQDIRLELQSFGVDTNDPEVIMNRVNEKIGDLYANYQTTARGLGMDLQFQFGERPLGGANEFGSQEAAQEAIERGDIRVGDEVIINGQRFRVQE